jgi:hypothetical protein
MRHRTRRSLGAGLLALALLTPLAGCGDGDPGSADDTTEDRDAPEGGDGATVAAVVEVWERREDGGGILVSEDPVLWFDPEEYGAVETGEIDFPIGCGPGTVELYAFADADDAEEAAEGMRAEIEAFSCAPPAAEGEEPPDPEMEDLVVGVNGNVVAVSANSSLVESFEDLDLGSDAA